MDFSLKCSQYTEETRYFPYTLNIDLRLHNAAKVKGKGNHAVRLKKTAAKLPPLKPGWIRYSGPNAELVVFKNIHKMQIEYSLEFTVIVNGRKQVKEYPDCEMYTYENFPSDNGFPSYDDYIVWENY